MRYGIPPINMKRVDNDRQTTLTHDFTVGHEYEVVVRAIGPDGTNQAMGSAVRGVINIVGEQFPPHVPTVLTATGFLLSITLAWVNPSNYDMDKMEIWRATVNNRDFAEKVAEVKGITYIDVVGEANVTRYYWIRAVDTSGNISGYYPSTIDPNPPFANTGVSGTTVGVVATDIDDFAVTATKMFNKTIILSADAWTNNSPGAGSVAWNAHSVVYNGVSYPIDAGNTSSAYIYWTIGDTAYSAVATHPSLGTTAFMVAINTTGIHTLVWNSSANMVIGTAFIANLAVTNAKINDLSASKLTAGTIDASIITVTNINASNISTGTLLARTIRTATSGARFDIMYPDIGTIRAIDDVGGVVFEIYIAGTDVGDVTIGDFAGDKGCRWDKSAGTFTVRGILNADDLVAGAIDASTINVTNLNATNITTGTLTGRTVQTASSGQRIVLDVADNTFRLLDTSGNTLVRIDDAVWGARPGIAMTEPGRGGQVRIDDDAGHTCTLFPGGLELVAASGNMYMAFGNFNGVACYRATIATGKVGNFLRGTLGAAETILINQAGDIDTAGFCDAAAGFKDNGTAGVDGTFIDNGGNTITVSGGIITALS